MVRIVVPIVHLAGPLEGVTQRILSASKTKTRKIGAAGISARSRSMGFADTGRMGGRTPWTTGQSS